MRTDLRSAPPAEVRDLDIAVVGMACRVPGAPDLEAFFDLLRSGRVARRALSEEELSAAGVSAERRAQSGYVRAAYEAEGIRAFDADFFGFTPQEARQMDPQQRLLLECCWHALEDAGYAGSRDPGPVGVYVSKSSSQYLMRNLLSHYGPERINEMRMVWNGNEANYAASLISYKLGLTGPSVNVQSACSSSLLAVSAACSCLLNYEAGLVLAGGCRLAVPEREGYLWRPGEILSPDGYCRPFDAAANGTVPGSGVGVVALRRLEDALRDGDQIYAVIRGYGVNNDGQRKVGYASPSIEGERDAIRQAQLMAEVEPCSITMIEAHGTATELGDPIEIAALQEVFGAAGAARQFCAIGAVKANIGHLDTASGIAGLIKACLALHHGIYFPNPHYERANPAIDFAASAFYVNRDGADWQPDVGVRRAGVSSFGIGGTNVHVVLEEARVDERRAALGIEAAARVGEADEGPQLVLLAAGDEEALRATAERLHGFVASTSASELSVGEIAYTLARGRAALPVRAAFGAATRDELLAQLEQLRHGAQRPLRSDEGRRLVFCFPGQGSQRPGAAAALYAQWPEFRRTLDRLADVARELGAADPRDYLLQHTLSAEAEARFARTDAIQVILFCFEYALAAQLLAYGLRPDALIGHSLGEYVAAVLSGLWRVEDALRLVVTRAQAVAALPPGAMLAVRLSAADAEAWCGDGVSLAIENGPDLCVLAGPEEAIAALSARLPDDVEWRRLRTSHALHTPAMAAAAAPLRALCAGLDSQAPQIPFVSGVTGDWIREEEARDADYWVRHLCEPLRMRQACLTLGEYEDCDFVELGPGRSMRSILRSNLGLRADDAYHGLLAGPERDDADDVAAALSCLGGLWQRGQQLDLAALYDAHAPRIVGLPGYPFARSEHWIAERSTPRQSPLYGEEAAPREAHSTGDGRTSDPHADGRGASAAEALDDADAPQNELEQFLTETLAEVMGYGPIGMCEDLLELGAHSLIASQFIARVWDQFAVELSIADFMAHPTLRAIAELILDRLLAAGAGAALADRDDETQPDASDATDDETRGANDVTL